MTRIIASVTVLLALTEALWADAEVAVASGGTVITGYWNSTNTAISFSFNTPDLASYDGATAYIYRVIGADQKVAGHAVSGLVRNTPYNESVPASYVETAEAEFVEGATMFFRVKYYDTGPALLNTVDAAETFFIDQIAPTAPTNLDLQAGDDSGTSSTDNITTATTPNFDFDNVTSGHYIALRFNGGTVGSKTAGAASETLAPGSAQNDGTYSVTVTDRDLAGNTSNASIAVSLTIDNVAPGPPNVPDLDGSSDTGYDNTDDITNDTTPTFTISGIATSELIQLYSNAAGTNLVASGWSGGSSISRTSSILGSADYDMTAKSTDRAGNVSNLSGALSLTVDTNAPGAPAAPDLTTDTGILPADNVTNNVTPTFQIGSVSMANLISLQFGGGEVDTGIAAGATINLTASTQTDGDYTVIATQTDPAGNTSPVSVSLDITIDASAPGDPDTPDLIDASDSGRLNSDDITNDDTPTFEVTSVVATDRITLFFDGVTETFEDASSTTATITAGAQADGTYLVTARSQDIAGNNSGYSAALSVTIDKTAPTPPSAPDLQGGSDTGVYTTDDNTSDITPTFDIAGVVSGDSILVEVDAAFSGGIIAAAATATITTSPLGPGSLSVTAKAVDVAGNTSAASSALALILDTTPPAPPSEPDLLIGDDSGRSNTDDITDVTTPTHSIGGVTSGDRIALLFDGISVAVGTAAGTSIDLAPSLAQIDGSFAVTAEATDPAGNTSNASTALSIVIDTQAPNAPGTPDMQPGSDSGSLSTDDLTNDDTPTFDISGVNVSDEIDLNFDGVSQSNDIATSGTVILTPGGAIVDGAYAVTATATDVAGNISSASTGLAVTIDTTPPIAPATPDLDAASDAGTSDTDDLTNVAAPTITVSGVTVNDNVSVRFDGIEKGSGTAAGASISITTSTVPEATYTVTATTTDMAGNTSGVSGGLSLTIDTTPPDIPLKPDLLPGSDSGIDDTDEITNVNNPTFQITDVDGLLVGDVIALEFSGVEVVTGTATAATIDLTPSAQIEGNYNVSARTSDVAGNSSGLSPVLALTIDLTAPTIALTYTDTLVKETDPIALTATFSEPAAATPAVDIAYAGAGPDIIAAVMDPGASSSLWTYDATTPAGNDGTVIVAITGEDLAGNPATIASGATDLEVDNTLPVISAVAPAASSYRLNTNVSYTLSEDILSGTITWTRTGGATDPGAPHVQPLTGTELDLGAHTAITLTNDPTLVSGSVYSVAFSGQDGAGNVAATITSTNVTFDNIVPTAALTYSDTLAKEGETVTVTVTFNEPAAATPQIGLEYTVNTIPATGMTATGDPAIWTHDVVVLAGNDGYVTVSVTGYDVAGNALDPDSLTNTVALLIDNTVPGYVLSYTDSLVKAADVTTITARFTEPVQATPTISVDYAGAGPHISLVAMLMAANDSIWTYQATTPTGNDGPATVTIAALDYAGNTAAVVTGDDALVVDNTRPSINTSAPLEGEYVSHSQVTYSISETIDSGQVTWTWESGPADGASPHVQLLVTAERALGSHSGELANAPALVQGATYTLEFLALDAAGNADTAQTLGVTYDTISPAVVLIYSDTLASAGDTVTITATFTEVTIATPQIAFAYQATGVAATVMTATVDDTIFTYDAIIPSVDSNDGTVTVTITADDRAGNAVVADSTANDTSLTIDDTPPGYVLAYSDSLVKQGDPLIITATFTESAKTTPGPVISIDYAGPGAPDSVSMIMGVADTIWTYATTAPASNDGFVTVTIAGTDLADNAMVPISGHINTLLVDNTLPEITVTEPDSGGFRRTTSVTYNLPAAIDSGSVTWTRESGPVDNTPHVQVLTTTELAAGTHDTVLVNAPTLVQGTTYTLDFIILDEAGNPDSTTIKSVMYDTVAPNSAGAVLQDSLDTVDIDSTQSTTSLAGSFDGFTDDASGIASYQYAIGSTQGDTDVVGWTSIGTDTTFTATGLSLDLKAWYWLMARATDRAGNVSDTVFTDDGVRIISRPAPTIAVVQNSALPAYVQIFITDTLGMANSFTVKADSVPIIPSRIDTFDYSYLVNHKLLAAGTLDVEVTGHSAAGDSTITDSIAIALAKRDQSWGAHSLDKRFLVQGPVASVKNDLFLIVADSRNFLSREKGRGSYRLAYSGLEFAVPVKILMQPLQQDPLLAKGKKAQAVYRLAPGGGWEELPTVDEGNMVVAWSKRAGNFRLGPRTIFVPQTTSLHHNYPNPFNPSTRIVFDLGFQEGPEQRASVIIYNLLGQEVRTLHNGVTQAGRYELVWRGIDRRGANVASGVYFVRLSTGAGHVEIKKMLLVR